MEYLKLNMSEIYNHCFILFVWRVLRVFGGFEGLICDFAE